MIACQNFRGAVLLRANDIYAHRYRVLAAAQNHTVYRAHVFIIAPIGYRDVLT